MRIGKSISGFPVHRKPRLMLASACCQFQPIHSDVAGSIAKADKLLEGLKDGEVDLLLLPEMALTGDQLYM